jgi:hypothetical protein
VQVSQALNAPPAALYLLQERVFVINVQHCYRCRYSRFNPSAKNGSALGVVRQDVEIDRSVLHAATNSAANTHRWYSNDFRIELANEGEFVLISP